MSATGNGKSSPLVLVVDDEPSVRATLSLCLRAAGYETICAEDGCAAQQLINDFNPSAIVTDIFMPDRDGLETITAFRREFPATRIVAMSGGGVRVDGALYLETAEVAGADAVLRKPFDPDALLQVLRDLAAARRA